jgi:hypothetical protein
MNLKPSLLYKVTMAAALTVAFSSGAAADIWARAWDKQIKNGNTPTRSCARGSCTVAVHEGSYMLLLVEGKGNKPVARMVCKFNAQQDRRRCVDVDNGDRYSAKRSGGRWVAAE